jgi:hypothetical protein
MSNRIALHIGLFAALAICFQNGGAALGFGWGLIHGAGLAAVVAFLPLALGLGALWAGYVYLSRRNVRHAPVFFTAYALAILLLNESLLPATPLAAWRAQRAVEAVEIRNTRDELVLSARGNPIGIRFSFEAIFPRNGDYAIGGTLQSVDERPYALQFNHSFGVRGMGSTAFIEIDPAPSDDHYFRQGVVYTVRQVLLPNFLSYDDRAGEPCLTEMYVEKDFVSALSKSRNLKYRAQIRVGSEQADREVTAAEYVTSRAYDLGAMYRTIETEGNRRCGS